MECWYPFWSPVFQRMKKKINDRNVTGNQKYSFTGIKLTFYNLLFAIGWGNALLNTFVPSYIGTYNGNEMHMYRNKNHRFFIYLPMFLIHNLTQY